MNFAQPLGLLRVMTPALPFFAKLTGASRNTFENLIEFLVTSFETFTVRKIY